MVEGERVEVEPSCSALAVAASGTSFGSSIASRNTAKEAERSEIESKTSFLSLRRLCRKKRGQPNKGSLRGLRELLRLPSSHKSEEDRNGDSPDCSRCSCRPYFFSFDLFLRQCEVRVQGRRWRWWCLRLLHNDGFDGWRERSGFRRWWRRRRRGGKGWGVGEDGGVRSEFVEFRLCVFEKLSEALELLVCQVVAFLGVVSESAWKKVSEGRREGGLEDAPFLHALDQLSSSPGLDENEGDDEQENVEGCDGEGTVG